MSQKNQLQFKLLCAFMEVILEVDSIKTYNSVKDMLTQDFGSTIDNYYMFPMSYIPADYLPYVISTN